MTRRLHTDRRGGGVLDLVIAFAVILLGAFALHQLGFTFHQILVGAGRFFGH